MLNRENLVEIKQSEVDEEDLDIDEIIDDCLFDEEDEIERDNEEDLRGEAG